MWDIYGSISEFYKPLENGASIHAGRNWKFVDRHFTGVLIIFQIKLDKPSSKLSTQRPAFVKDTTYLTIKNKKTEIDFEILATEGAVMRWCGTNSAIKTPKICERNQTYANTFYSSFLHNWRKSSCVILPASHPKLLQNESKENHEIIENQTSTRRVFKQKALDENWG